MSASYKYIMLLCNIEIHKNEWTCYRYCKMNGHVIDIVNI